MLRVRVLGKLALESDGDPLEPPASLRARLLLGWLALNPGAHSRSELAARLRPDVLDESARQSLRHALWALRGVLGDGALSAGRERVGLADGVWVDAREFAELVAAGDAEGALGLVRGELLAGLDDDWVLAERDAQRLREDEALAALADGADDPQRALALARRRADLDPLSEPAHRDLMERMAAAGDRAGALAVYERLRRRLQRGLGAPPSPATRQLAATLRRGDVSAPSSLPPSLAAAAARPFVGRRRELESALARLQEARSGALRTVLIAGEPGMGKTRLAAQVAAIACAGGAAVLSGRCDEEPLSPYQPWVEALAAVESDGLSHAVGPELARLVPGLASGDEQVLHAGDAAGERPRLFDGVLSLLGRVAPAVVVLDDLHWADAGSLRLLVHVSRAAPRIPLLVIGTYRHTEPAHELRRALADMRGDPAVARLRLHGMGDAEVAELVRQLCGETAPRSVTDSLSERTGGLPFFVEEVVRAAGGADGLGTVDGVPEGVREVIGRRIERLGPDAHEPLLTGAVMGSEFHLRPLAAAIGADRDSVADRLDRAVSAGLLVEPEGEVARFAFTHALVREALLAGLGATRRARLHAAVARALAGEPRPEAAALALHYAAAAELGFERETVEWCARAACEAVAMLGYEEAVGHLERALAVAAEDGPRGELLLQLGDALARAGEALRARGAFEEAAALARRARDGRLLARAAVGCGGLGVALVDVDRDLIALLEEALAAPGADEPGLRARLLGRLAVELYYTGEEGRARGLELTREAVELARAAGDRDALARALAARHVALWRPDRLDERIAVAAELIELGGEAELEGRHWRFVDMMELGDAPAAHAELEAYERLAGELRVPAWSWYVPVWRGTLALIEGRWDDARALIDAGHAAGRRAQDANADLFRLIQTSAVLIEQRRFTELELDDEVLARAESPEAGHAWRSGFTWLFSFTGDAERGRAMLREDAAGDFAELPWDANRLSCLVEYAEAAMLLEEHEIAARVERLLLPFADRHAINARAFNTYGPVHAVLGRLRATRGELDAAVADLDSAIASLMAFNAAPRLANVRAELAAVLRERAGPGDKERAAALQAAAEEGAQQLGCPTLLTA